QRADEDAPADVDRSAAEEQEVENGRDPRVLLHAEYECVACARSTRSPRGATLVNGRKQSMRRQKRDRTGRAEDMITFARVVEAGSLTRAAKSLGTTRSAVSKSITRL